MTRFTNYWLVRAYDVVQVTAQVVKLDSPQFYVYTTESYSTLGEDLFDNEIDARLRFESNLEHIIQMALRAKAENIVARNALEK